MPSVFSHAVFAAAMGKAYTTDPLPTRFWVLTVLSAVLPDLDVIGFAFGIRYSSMLGHRGITHSIAFAVLAGILFGTLAFRGKLINIGSGALILYFTLTTLSHPLLDALTNGGLGVALFAPFSPKRYFLPWRPIEVSPIGAGFFSERGLEVLFNEMVWVWIPSLLLVLLAFVFRRLTKSGTKRDYPKDYA